MHHKAGGLVQHDQVGILVQNLQRDILGQGLDLCRRGQAQAVNLPFGNLGLAIGHRHPVAADGPLLDHPRQARAGQGGFFWHKFGQCLI